MHQLNSWQGSLLPAMRFFFACGGRAACPLSLFGVEDFRGFFEPAAFPLEDDVVTEEPTEPEEDAIAASPWALPGKAMPGSTSS